MTPIPQISKPVATLLAGLLSLVAVGGCQNQPEKNSTPDGQQDAARLEISYRPQAAERRQVVELICSNSERQPNPACATVFNLPKTLWQPLPANRACTLIYGGAEQAQVRGTISGQKIDQRFSRRDGCQIARWDQLAPLLDKLGLA